MFYELKKMKKGMSRRMGALAFVGTAILMTASPLAAQEAAVTAEPAPAADSPASGMAQAEIIKRQELVFRATQSIDDGEKAEKAGDYKSAIEKYSFAYENLAPSQSTDAAIKRAREGIVRISSRQYNEATKNADTAGAIRALETIVKYDANNKAAKDRLAKIKANQQQPEQGSVIGNPAVTPQLVGDLHAIDQLLIEAEQYYRTGQYPEAEARYKKVLAIDKFNVKATEGLEKIIVQKKKYDAIAQEATRAERLRDVQERWILRQRRDTVGTTTVVASTPFTRSTQFAISQKLKTMVLKDLVFSDATIEDAALALAARSKELDPETGKLGISFIVKPEAVSSAKTFSLNLRNIPMEEALRYITKLANVKYKVEEFAVVIVPIKESTEVMLRRSFNVPPSFFPPPAAAGASGGNAAGGTRRPLAIVSASSSDSSTGNNDVKSLLEERGVDFKDVRSSAIYYPASGVLQVVNTQEQLDLIEELVSAGTTPTYMIDVQTKLVEIAQTDLNELTFNVGVYSSGGTYPSGSSSGLYNFGSNGLGGVPVNSNGVPNGQVAGTTALRGSQAIKQNGVDALLHGNAAATPNIFSVSGHITNQVFNFVMAAMAQKRSFDMLSAPSLRVKNSEDATINISRSFSYPTAFDPAESASVQSTTTTTSGNSDTSTGPPVVIPAFPTEFETRDIGVKMKVRPQLGSDNKTIDLALFPEVTDFEGFVDYGSPIYVVASNESGDETNSYLVTANHINQPIFNTRRIDTKVLVRDGYTVVLGGLMRDDVQTVTDKVPFLGDLPLVGRLFQSKASQSQKKNLLIFVTCRIYLNSGELLNPPTPETAMAGVPTASR